MYAVGDLIIYGTTGVCRVDAITDPPMQGMDKSEKYYRLKPLYQDGSVYCPVRSPKVTMRPVLTKEEAERLVDLIPTIQADSCRADSTQQLAEHYQQMVSSSSCEDLITLVMGLYAKKQYLTEQRRKFGQMDERYMKRALGLLHGELAVALGIAPEEVEGYISARVGKRPGMAVTE